MRYYNDDLRSVFVVDETWPEKLKTSTVEMLLSKGFLPIDDSGASTAVPSMFVNYVEGFEKSQDGTLFRLVQTPVPTTILFDRDKFFAKIAEIEGAQASFMTLVDSDSDVKEFWFVPSYTRGSTLASKICIGLDISQTQLENIVKECV